MISTNILRYGSDTPLPTQHLLRAGPLTLVYEAGDLRYIRLGQREVLRRVYVAVRDHNWGTVPARLSNERIDVADSSFRISYEVAHQQSEIDFAWRGQIVGESDGTIRFTMEGQARTTFVRNRIGFCVLHPPSCAGAPCRIEHVDGVVETSAFPSEIAPQRIEGGQVHPHYPFAEMRALSHEVAPGAWAEVRFDGEIFELEDQRNWIDGSYKTYGTPQRLPQPATITAGTQLRQSVTLTLRADEQVGQPDPVVPRSSALFRVPSLSNGLALPRIGLGVASHGQPLDAGAIERLRALRPAHLRVDLLLSDIAYVEQLRQAADEARALDTSLEAALFISDAAELAQLRAALDQLAPSIATWLIFHASEPTTSAAWVQLAREHLGSYAPQAIVASGTNRYFTDLNRGRPAAGQLDALSYSINPQVHAFDNTSLIETAETIGATVASARKFCAGKPIMISPITLRPRLNPVATGPERRPKPGLLPRQVDPRQMSLFGACWTLTSLKYLAESGVASATYYETTGWRGVLETSTGSPLPERFPSLAGAVFPLYHVLADVQDFAGGELLPTISSDTLAVDGLALRRGDTIRLLLANLTNAPLQVRVPALAGMARLRVLDELNAEAAMRDPAAFRAEAGAPLAAGDGMWQLDLLPYALARIDATTTDDRRPTGDRRQETGDRRRAPILLWPCGCAFSIRPEGTRFRGSVVQRFRGSAVLLIGSTYAHCCDRRRGRHGRHL